MKNLVNRLVRKEGSQNKLAKRLGVTRAYVNRMIKEGPGPAFLVLAWTEYKNEFGAEEFWRDVEAKKKQ